MYRPCVYSRHTHGIMKEVVMEWSKGVTLDDSPCWACKKCLDGELFRQCVEYAAYLEARKLAIQSDLSRLDEYSKKYYMRALKRERR